MANYCEYRVIVKGKQNACYAFFGSMSCLETKDIYDESGSYEDYTVKFTGNCKWSVDCYCTPWEGDFPVTLPEDPDDACMAGEELYWYNTVQERSKMFEVEVWCNSADIEDYDDHPFEVFEHYLCGDDMGCDYSGCNEVGLCPAELRIFGRDEEESGDCCMCLDCCRVLPVEICHETEEGAYLCEQCYARSGYTAPTADEDPTPAEDTGITSPSGDNTTPADTTDTAAVLSCTPTPAEDTGITSPSGDNTTPADTTDTAAAADTTVRRSRAWVFWLIAAAIIAAAAAVCLFYPPAAEAFKALFHSIAQLFAAR